MRNNLVLILKYLLIFLLLCVPALSLQVVNADSGWDSNYDSGGSWDSGGSSGSGGYSDSGDISSFSEIIGLLIIFIIYMLIVFVWTIVKSLLNFIKRKVFGIEPPNKQNEDNSSYSNINNKLTASYTYQNTNDDFMSNTVSDAKIKEFLPGESINSLENMAFDLFVDIQNAWMEFDYNKLRELCTDELYNSYVSQLETLKLKNGKNIMKNFVKYDVKITDVKEENGNIVLTVYLYVHFYDYVINQKTNAIIRGSNCVRVSNKYLMTFVKGTNNDDSKCPNCGAEITSNVSGVCEYCHSTIVKKASNFVLSKKTNINK